MGRVLYALIVITLTGCATVYEECEKYEGEELKQCNSDVRQYRTSMDYENWALCERLILQAGKYTLHKDHSHDRGVSTQHSRDAWVKSDLMMNHCRMLIPKDYWADY